MTAEDIVRKLASKPVQLVEYGRNRGCPHCEILAIAQNKEDGLVYWLPLGSHLLSCTYRRAREWVAANPIPAAR